ncbi:MAG: hypothetical protein R6U98_06580 [Pirellulaceae bacterium]
MSFERIRPGLTNTFKEPLQGALKKIWWYLKNVAIGPEWRLYAHDDGLYLQHYDRKTKTYLSTGLWDSTGNYDALVSVAPDAICLWIQPLWVGAGAVVGTIQAVVPIPCDCTLEAVYMCCVTVAGAPAPTADIYDESIATPATILTGAVTLAAGNTTYNAGIASDDFSAGDHLSLRCVTAGAGGSITGLTATLLFRTKNTNTIYDRGKV